MSPDMGAREPQATVRDLLDRAFTELIRLAYAGSTEHDSYPRGLQWKDRAMEAFDVLAAGVGVPPDEDLVANSANYAEIRARAERLTRSIWGEPTRAEQAGLDVLTLLDALAGVGEARPAEPPHAFLCSGATYHLPACDGTCGELDDSVGAPAEEQPDARAEALQRARMLADPAYWRLCVQKGASDEQVADFARRSLAALTEELERSERSVVGLREQLDAARELLDKHLPYLEHSAYGSDREVASQLRAALGEHEVPT